MWSRTWYAAIALVAVVSVVTGPAVAQQGHPLSGSWHGEWGQPDGHDRMDLTVIVTWDGNAISGLVNPVTDRAEIRNATLNSSDWSVRFEVEVADASGQTSSCVANGTLDRVGSDRRTLAGTWICGSLETEFQLVRDRDY